MPVKRDSEGNIIDQPTRHESGPDNDRPTDHKPTDYKPAPPPGDSPYDAKTILAGTVKRETQEQANRGDEARTRVYRPQRDNVDTPVRPAPSAAGPPHAMEDPPVGWLVVVAGPGQGNVLSLGNGANSIGRDDTERLQLNFGDDMISRTNHTTVTYDPRGRQFYIQHGGGTNLTYINDQPVLAPQELQANTNILVGNTTLRFVPLCGAQFNWDTPEAD